MADRVRSIGDRECYSVKAPDYSKRYLESKSGRMSEGSEGKFPETADERLVRRGLFDKCPGRSEPEHLYPDKSLTGQL
jgi:hypothetical protein